MPVHRRLLILFFIVVPPFLSQCSSQPDVEEPVNNAEHHADSNDAEESVNASNASNASNANYANNADLEGNAEEFGLDQANEFALDAGGGNEGNLFAADNFDDTVDNLFAMEEVDQFATEELPPPSNPPAQFEAAPPVVVTAAPSVAPPASTTPLATSRAPTLKSADENFNAFQKHFASVLGGHPEGVHVVRSKTAAVYNGPGPQYKVVTYLKQGTDVHVMRRYGAWVKIGYGKYMAIDALRSYGLKTKGLEAYQSVWPQAPTAITP